MDQHEHLAELRKFLADTTSTLRVRQPFLRLHAEEWRNWAVSKDPREMAFDVERNPDINFAVVTVNEVNSRHGTGILLQRMFPDSSRILHVRSQKFYGDNDFGGEEAVLAPTADGALLYSDASNLVKQTAIGGVFCVPFDSHELRMAIALSQVANVPMGFYIMDDQNLAGGHIDDETFSMAVEHASVRFGISHEMVDGYEQKFGKKFHLLPPVVLPETICREVIAPESIDDPKRGVLLGNFWEPDWLQILLRVLGDADIEIDWYGNSGGFIDVDFEELSENGLHFKGQLPEEDLVETIRGYAFTLLPSEPSDSSAQHWLARYSLPTRLVTAFASGNLPCVVVGAPDSAAAAFVIRNGIGEVSPYESGPLQEAVDKVTEPETQRHLRSRIAKFSKRFSSEGIDGWIRTSIETGSPPDLRFGDPSELENDSLVAWLEESPPAWVYHGDAEAWRVLSTLDRIGAEFDFMVDVGASTGTFTYLSVQALRTLRKDARLLMIDPLVEAYIEENPWYIDHLSGLEIHPVALSDRPGIMEIFVTESRYDSSCFSGMIEAESEPRQVPVETLDNLTEKSSLTGRGFLKVDVQGAESLVLDGASNVIELFDLVMLELQVKSQDPAIPDFGEMVGRMKQLGFRFFDESGGWRTRATGVREQVDAWFVREGVEWCS